MIIIIIILIMEKLWIKIYLNIEQVKRIEEIKKVILNNFSNQIILIKLG